MVVSILETQYEIIFFITFFLVYDGLFVIMQHIRNANIAYGFRTNLGAEVQKSFRIYPSVSSFT